MLWLKTGHARGHLRSPKMYGVTTHILLKRRGLLGAHLRREQSSSAATAAHSPPKTPSRSRRICPSGQLRPPIVKFISELYLMADAMEGTARHEREGSLRALQSCDSLRWVGAYAPACSGLNQHTNQSPMRHLDRHFKKVQKTY